MCDETHNCGAGIAMLRTLLAGDAGQCRWLDLEPVKRNVISAPATDAIGLLFHPLERNIDLIELESCVRFYLHASLPFLIDGYLIEQI
jgi:hypothetical protein